MKRPTGPSQGEACWITRFHNKHLNLFFSCAFNAKLGNDKRRIMVAAFTSWWKLEHSCWVISTTFVSWTALLSQHLLMLFEGAEGIVAPARGGRWASRINKNHYNLSLKMSGNACNQTREFFSEGSSEGGKKDCNGNVSPRPAVTQRNTAFDDGI